MIKDFGQDSNTWSAVYDTLSPVSEIQMWDYYGISGMRPVSRDNFLKN